MVKKFIDEPIDIEELFPLVVKESDAIKQFFTSKEINRLNIDIEEFDTTYKTDCIYGKMVGDCNSKRVSEFIEKNLETLVKGNYFEKPFPDTGNDRTFQFFTPLEDYIYGYDANDEESDKFDEAKSRLEKVLGLILN